MDLNEKGTVVLFNNTVNYQDGIASRTNESNFHTTDFTFLFNSPFRNIKSKFHLTFSILAFTCNVSAAGLSTIQSKCPLWDSVFSFKQNKCTFNKMLSCSAIKVKCGTLVEWYWQQKTKVLGEKPLPAPPCPPQTRNGLVQVRSHSNIFCFSIGLVILGGLA